MKVLVTGGTGVVGAAAIPALLHAGHDVRLLSRHAQEDARSFPTGVEPFVANVADPGPLRRAVEGCDCVLHIAGIVEEEPPEVTFEKVNVQGTDNLLAAARDASRPRFIYLSSLGADRGQSEYHRSKRRAEELVRQYDGAWSILRPGNVYGPGDETISTLLKMVRTLPAVPVIAGGDQPFQPVWYGDLGNALARAIANRRVTGATLELAGPDVTTTTQLLDRLAAITGRNPPRLDFPVWATEIGVQALEAFGAAGKKLLRRAAIGVPLKSATVTMLLEENVIADGSENALISHLDVTPTPLQEGLEMLAYALPVQLPGDGVGRMHDATYSADIHGPRHSAASLLDQMCEQLRQVMPIEFSAEPAAATQASKGTTLTARLPSRGHIQVRLAERTPQCATLVTIESHPIAGIVQLRTEDISGGVRFTVRTVSQPANIVDWVALRTVGGAMQTANWRDVVRRVVSLSGGTAPGGVRYESHTLSEQDAGELRRFTQRIVQEQERESPRTQALHGLA